MNPKPGWVRNMANIFEMIERIESLNEIKENRRKSAAKVLRQDICAFVAHEGQSYVYDCPNTGQSYILMDDGNVIVKNEDEEEVETKDLSIEEMELLREFMVEHLNYELKFEEEEIDRYTNLCL